MRQKNIIHMLFRCTMRKYAESFLKLGNVKFSTPLDWIKWEETEGKGRGDILEGSFISVQDKGNEIKVPKGMMIQRKNGYIYLQRKKTLQLPSFCLFGLGSYLFTKQTKDLMGRNLLVGSVAENYFKDFSEGLTKNEAKKISKEKQPVVVIIKQPKEFFDRVISYLKTMGIGENEILIQPICYINKKDDFSLFVNSPYELFYKDKDFSYQNEIRIVIDSSNDDAIEKLKKSGGICNIGNLEDIAYLQEYYYEKEMVIGKDNNTILYTLPEPIVKSFTEMPLKELVGMFFQISEPDFPPECIKNGSVKQMCETLNGILREKYNVEIHGKTLMVYGDNYEEIIKQLQEKES